ncbi:unnamed protein product [Ectocarpus sp. CCAP 1310/34]|nr:unnamed protein product [Ectocarpus sp. CCAP 1310/34]
MSSSSSIKASALLLLAAAQVGCGQNLTSCEPSTNGAFDYQVTPTDGFEVHWSVDTVAETISIEVVSTAVAWTSLGFSSDLSMVGSDAVIGLPEESTVEEYDLTSHALAGVVLSSTQDITGGSVSQDASGTTLSFTRPLAPANKQAISGTPGDETIFIYAFGEGNELAFHGQAPNRGDLTLDLFCGEGGDGATVAGTPAPTVGGTPAASEASSTAPIAADTLTAAPTMAVSGTPPSSTLSMAPTTVETETGSSSAPSSVPTIAPTMVAVETGSSSAPSAAPTGVEASTSSPTGAAGATGSETMAPSAADGDRGVDVPGETGAPTDASDSLRMTESPSSAGEGPVDEETDGALRVGGGGRWAAAAATGFVTVLAVLSSL